ncbi:TIGR02450 family Trp-rich protein [Aliivibrio finisterrensis]|uniref:TIGR02450 family Trp-rich protein n=1 Tax=Aliivibrio finisterrensis TaxID=511998 RepID=A0A6N6RXM7_9GAMM|nr:TIGR02450 family Trp-rich protein [Aliivibrio finisterrensis]KAB2826142.1 TIGR02450 family Trp-rich protein [Aliivibrio finisterrensis]
MNKINPKKLLNSKWTAVNPVQKEKHFLITEIEFEENEVTHCLIEAIITKRTQSLDWEELKNQERWLSGWK